MLQGALCRLETLDLMTDDVTINLAAYTMSVTTIETSTIVSYSSQSSKDIQIGFNRCLCGWINGYQSERPEREPHSMHALKNKNAALIKSQKARDSEVNT